MRGFTTWSCDGLDCTASAPISSDPPPGWVESVVCDEAFLIFHVTSLVLCPKCVALHASYPCSLCGGTHLFFPAGEALTTLAPEEKFVEDLYQSGLKRAASEAYIRSGKTR